MTRPTVSAGSRQWAEAASDWRGIRCAYEEPPGRPSPGRRAQPGSSRACRRAVAVQSVEVSARDIEQQARQASDRVVRDTSPWIARLGRFGHVAIGLVYATIGVLAAQAALSRGGQTTDSH